MFGNRICFHSSFLEPGSHILHFEHLCLLSLGNMPFISRAFCLWEHLCLLSLGNFLSFFLWLFSPFYSFFLEVLLVGFGSLGFIFKWLLFLKHLFPVWFFFFWLWGELLIMHFLKTLKFFFFCTMHGIFKSSFLLTLFLCYFMDPKLSEMSLPTLIKDLLKFFIFIFFFNLSLCPLWLVSFLLSFYKRKI